MTRTSRPRARSLVASVIALGLVAAACGGDDDADEPAPAEEPAAEEPAAEEPAADEPAAEEPAAEEPAAEEPAAEEPAAEEPAAEEPAAEEPAAEEPKEDITLTMGGSAASSSVFAFLAAHVRLMGDADGAMTVNVRETGASVENIQLVEEGSTEFGLSALSVLIQAHRGINTFEGEAFPNHCNLINYLNNGEFMTVHEDIETVYDLEGKSFAPGFQGSATFDNHMAYFDALGIEIDVFDGSLEDIVNAMKDGRIVGFGKSANGFTADATMLDVASSVPVKVIGFTQEDVDKIMAADPVNEVLYVFTEIEEGAIFDNEQTFVSSILASYFTSTEVTDEDTQYRITKSAWEAIDEAAEQASYAGSANRTIEETLSTADIMPLCPGAQRYYDEVS